MNGSQLRAWRHHHHISGNQLAGQLDIPRNTLYRWERGELRIEHGRILELALTALENRPPQP